MLSISRSHAWIAGFPADQLRVLDADVPAREVGDEPAGFADQEHARGDVPGREMLLPEAVEPAGGHVGQVERGRAGPADTAGRAAPRARTVEIFLQSARCP